MSCSASRAHSPHPIRPARAKTAFGKIVGGLISPLLANIFLHYILDLWVHQWRGRHARGRVSIVRYADDFVMGFENAADARRMLEDLKERLTKFGLALHEDKTRLIEFGRLPALYQGSLIRTCARVDLDRGGYLC